MFVMGSNSNLFQFRPQGTHVVAIVQQYKFVNLGDIPSSPSALQPTTSKERATMRKRKYDCLPKHVKGAAKRCRTTVENEPQSFGKLSKLLRKYVLNVSKFFQIVFQKISS